MNDAEVLYAVARRLFAESFAKFRRAHANSLRSANALTIEKQLELFGEAIEQEKQAIATQAEAIENQKQAFRIWRAQLSRDRVTFDVEVEKTRNTLAAASVAAD